MHDAALDEEWRAICEVDSVEDRCPKACSEANTASARECPTMGVVCRAHRAHRHARGGLSPETRRMPAARSPRFTGEIVDAKNSGDCKAVADLDDDGLLDGVVGGADLVWYEAPDWKKHTIAEAQDEFTTDCQAADVDRDGHVDIVVPDGKDGMNLLWFENPGSPDATWPRHEIGSFGDFVHDLEVGDLDGDGRVDVVTRSGAKPTSVWYQLSPSKWREQVIGDRAGDGTSIGDVDDDGDLDVMTGGYWLENDGSAGLWPQHEIEAADAASTFVADVDGDGKNDVFIGPNEAEGQVSWYRAGPTERGRRTPLRRTPTRSTTRSRPPMSTTTARSTW